MRVAIIGAGVGGLAAGVRLARAGHAVTVFEATAVPGGKVGRASRGGFTWDSGPSLLTMPWTLRDLVGDSLELLRVEPVTRYAFADGTGFDLSADLPRAMEALEAWSPGAGTDWARFLGVCASMWRASEPFLNGPPPWPPRRPAPGAPAPDPRDLLRVRPWLTLRGLARRCVRDPRLRMVIERFATYAGADPRRAPAALALAGYVEHAFGAWHPRGGIHGIVEALVRALEAAGGELRLGEPVARVLRAYGRASGVELAGGAFACDAVVTNAEAAPRIGAERSLSGFALMLGLSGRTDGLVHHHIRFPADYDAEFDDVFVHRRPVREPTLYTSVPAASEPGGEESWFVLANAPARSDLDWSTYGDVLLDRLGPAIRARVVARAERSPADLERESGARGGAIYGDAPHGRLATLRRPPNAVRGVRGLWRVGGTTHPGGGLPLVMLGAKVVADQIGPA